MTALARTVSPFLARAALVVGIGCAVVVLAAACALKLVELI